MLWQQVPPPLQPARQGQGCWHHTSTAGPSVKCLFCCCCCCCVAVPHGAPDCPPKHAAGGGGSCSLQSVLGAVWDVAGECCSCNMAGCSCQRRQPACPASRHSVAAVAPSGWLTAHWGAPQKSRRHITTMTPTCVCVACCCAQYWVLVLAPLPIMAGIWWVTRWHVLWRVGWSECLGLNSESHTIPWTPRSTLLYPALCIIVGAVAGLLGLGGGSLMVRNCSPSYQPAGTTSRDESLRTESRCHATRPHCFLSHTT